jgi:hypothetical protein
VTYNPREQEKFMPPLNRNQLSCLWFGVLLIIAMGLVPPWREATGARNLLDYAVIFMPPPSTLTSGVTIDFSRLVVEWILALVLTGGLIATFQSEGEGRHELAKSGSGSKKAPPVLPDNAPISTKPTVVQGREQISSQLQAHSAAESGPVLKFPQESIGELLVESAEDPEYWETYSAAAGKVALPIGKRLQLELEKDRIIDCHKLESLPAEAFFSIDLSNSKVTDADLKAIGRFVGLRELDLSDTLITDVGIKNLSALTNLQKIWLDNTRVTDKGLADLANHTELIKISVVGTQINEPAVDALAGAFQQKCDVVLGDS